MLFSMLLALAAAEPIDCPPVGSAARDRLKSAGEICRDDQERTDKLVAEGRKFRERGAAFKDRPFPAEMRTQVRAVMNQDLRDGPTARYQWLAWKHPDVYCFEVNGKNAFGAYSGWSTYAVNISKGRVTGVAEMIDCDEVR